MPWFLDFVSSSDCFPFLLIALFCIFVDFILCTVLHSVSLSVAPYLQPQLTPQLFLHISQTRNTAIPHPISQLLEPLLTAILCTCTFTTSAPYRMHHYRVAAYLLSCSLSLLLHLQLLPPTLHPHTLLKISAYTHVFMKRILTFEYL